MKTVLNPPKKRIKLGYNGERLLGSKIKQNSSIRTGLNFNEQKEFNKIERNQRFGNEKKQIENLFRKEMLIHEIETKANELQKSLKN